MADKPTWQDIEHDRDRPVDIPLDPDEALRALLKVDPESEPVVDSEAESPEKNRRPEGRR